MADWYQPNPHIRTADVLQALRDSGKPLHEWGRAVDGTPMLAARTGGAKQPAIFITAGAHSTETAGVHAALNLLSALQTDHEVHILPLRDPMGFGGVAHCLSQAAGRPVRVGGHDDARDYLQTHAELLWKEERMQVFSLGDFGFAWHESEPDGRDFLHLHARLISLARDKVEALQSLRGKRVFLVCDMAGVEGSDKGQRCWQGVLSQEGEWLHLNRFFGSSNAPDEVRAVDSLLEIVRPGLTCDLHESAKGNAFWMPIPRPAQGAERVFNMVSAYFDYVNSRGYPVMSYDTWVELERQHDRGYTSDWIQPEPRLPGLFWIDGLRRREGANLMDQAGLYGIGFGTEAPTHQPLAMRVDAITGGIMAAIKVWEETG